MATNMALLAEGESACIRIGYKHAYTLLTGCKRGNVLLDDRVRCSIPFTIRAASRPTPINVADVIE